MKSILTQEDKIREVLATAVAALYFDDNSDFRGALWHIVQTLDEDLADLLESNPQEAYNKIKEVSKCH